MWADRFFLSTACLQCICNTSLPSFFWKITYEEDLLPNVLLLDYFMKKERERGKNFTAPQTNWEGRERGKDKGREGRKREDRPQQNLLAKMLVGLLRFPFCLLLCCHFLLDWWRSLFWKFHIKHSITQVHIKVLQARLDEMKTALADTQRNNYSPSPLTLPSTISKLGNELT